MTMTKWTDPTARTTLLEILPPGTEVLCSLEHVSRSGMARDIKLYVVTDGELRHISWEASHVLGWKRRNDRDGIRVGGCGMDMGFHLVYTLSAVLHRNGFDCIGDRCPSNDHSNGDRDRTPHHHRDGGYALRHRWI